MKKSLPFHSPVLANAVKQSSITYSSLRTQWSNPVSPTRHCEHSEAIQICFQLDRHGFASRWQLLVIANIVKQSSITYSSLRTQWSNPENKWIGLQVDRHGFASRWQLLFNRLRRPFHSWEFARIVCRHHFTAENLLKLSADTISQWGICSNRLRRPFHSWEFR